MKELVIKCRYYDKGCLWSGTVNELLKHLDSEDGCDFVTIVCPQECGATIERGDLHEHLEADCYISWTECTYCGSTIPTDSVDSHVDSVCPQYELACPNQCGQMVERIDIDAHRQTCPNELIPCNFKSSGCTQPIKRCEIEEHLQKNQVQHSLLMFNYLYKDLNKMKEQLEESQVVMKSQSEQIQSLTKRVVAAEQEMNSMKDKTLLIASTLTQELEYMSDEHPLAKSLAISCMRDQLSVLTNPLMLKLYPTGPFLTFRMPNFSKLKAADQSWCSLPFVVHNGYQMCIVVHPNGEGEGRNTHVSISLHLISGIFDDELKWPLSFTNEVVVSLMKQVPDAKPRPKIKMTYFDRHFLQQQRMRTLVHLLHRVNKPVGELGLAFGYIGLFCAQSNLEATALHNDSLVFQLSMAPS